MADLACKHCGSASFVRNGMAAGHQRYRCKACGRNFTAAPGRGKPPALRALAGLLYPPGNASQGVTAQLLGGGPPAGYRGGPAGRGAGAGPPGPGPVAVYRWARAAGEAAPAPSAAPSDGIAQIDEAWHFVGGEKQGSALAGLRPCGTANPRLGAGWAR